MRREAYNKKVAEENEKQESSKRVAEENEKQKATSKEAAEEDEEQQETKKKTAEENKEQQETKETKETGDVENVLADNLQSQSIDQNWTFSEFVNHSKTENNKHLFLNQGAEAHHVKINLTRKSTTQTLFQVFIILKRAFFEIMMLYICFWV